MIKFFRKIRKSLLLENKTSKYFKYAIGEIILVVIGILIALQINNWNEKRKESNLELKMLIDLNSNLKQNELKLLKGLKFNELTLKHYYKIADFLDYHKTYDTILDKSFGLLDNWDSPYFTKTAYEVLKNKGIDIIKNDIIRKEISELFETKFTHLVNDYDKSEWDFSISVKNSLLNKHFQQYLSSNKIFYYAKPTNITTLKKDYKFRNMLSTLINLRINGINMYKNVIKDIQKTNKLLELEIND